MNNRFRTILFDVAAVLVLLGAILYASDSRIAPYLYFLLDFARQGSKFQTKEITPLQCFCGVIDDLRLRSDVRRPQRVDHLPLHRGDPASLYSLRIRRQEKGSK